MELHVYEDCLELVKHFYRASQKVHHAEFELFCDCWRMLQFQHIFSAQTTHCEVMQTTSAALHVGKRLACGRETNGELLEGQWKRAHRIGAIYLLYAIYNKQPTEEFVKIEVSPQTWDELTGYVEELRSEDGDRRDTQQVSYIFWKLVQQGAFCFTALDYCRGLENLINYDQLFKTIQTERKGKKLNRELALKQQIRPADLDLDDEQVRVRALQQSCKSLRRLEMTYNHQKEQLAQGPKHHRALPNTNIFGHLMELFDDVGQLLRRSPTDEDQPSTSKSTAVASKGEARQLLKRKNAYNYSDRMDTRLEEEEAEEEDAGEDEAEDPVVEKRMSTIFGPNLPDELAKELELIEESSSNSGEM
ncbi:uncharacterized protein LOC115624418 [Scaptodrosophila lebanonensis]|uniref:Uncharacterized protein LOC115624418 n=1 Tax=Drosophila lebanonensis TaxID=7225 RepID=A0A6J2TIR5_DROLE|nr:uncharacterized protein LOC115624418 [Scaptodrosophila lebanonensis]